MGKLEVDVPVNTGKGSANSTSMKSDKSVKELEKLNKGIKKLDKDILLTVDVQQLLFSLFSDAMALFQPLIKILTLIGLILLLPLLPLIKFLVEKLKKFVDFLLKGDLERLGNALVDVIAAIWFLVALPFKITKFVLETLVKLGIFLWDVIVGVFNVLLDVGQWIWDNIIVAGFNILLSVGLWLFNNIIEPGFSFLSDVGKKLYDAIIEPGFSFLSNIGEKIWNGIKSGFDFFKNALRNIANLFIDIVNFVNPFKKLPHVAEGGIVTKPTVALIGEAGPEAIIPLNKGMGQNLTININKPTVRSDSDLKDMANQISRVLQRQVTGRVSSQ